MIKIIFAGRAFASPHGHGIDDHQWDWYMYIPLIQTIVPSTGHY